MTSRLQLTPQRLLPAVSGIHGFPDHTGEVAGDLDLAPLQRTDLFAAQPTDEVAKLKEYILPRARLRRSAFGAALVIRRKEYNRKADITVGFDLLNDGSAPISLFVQDDGLETQLLQKAGDGLPRTVI